MIVDMVYTVLGKLIKKEREKRNWEQADLAARVSRKQQTVSRWEKGDSKPKINDLSMLVELFSVNKDVWFAHAGYEIEEPDISLAPFLPIQVLSPDKFELFCVAVIQALNPFANVHRYGTQGDNQEGIDLYAKKGSSILDYQCKRHKQFGPVDISTAVKANTFKSDYHYLLLSRNASSQARKEILKYKNWDIWDREDISKKIRDLHNIDDKLQIVNTFFPGKQKTFLGIDETSPWLSIKDFFLPFENRTKMFSHGWTIVGRQKELDLLKEFGSQNEAQAIILSGRGGIGKSKLLKSWSENVDKTIPVKFISYGESIEIKDIELLPTGIAYLIVDDAHERSDISTILSGIVRIRPEMKVILSSRPYGITKLQDELLQSGVVYDTDKTIILGDINEKDVEKLSKEILDNSEIKGNTKLATRIAQITKDCPLATVIGSYLVGKGKLNPDLLANQKTFLDALMGHFKDVITGQIGGEGTNDLLDFISLVQPFDPLDPKFQQAIEKLLDKHYDKVIRDISVLEDSGILLRRGNKLRIVPDLLADYIRLKTSYDENNSRPTGYVDRIYNSLKGELATNLLMNISQLDWRLSTDNIQSKILDSIWAKIYSEIEKANNADRRYILKELKDMAYYQPKQFLELVKFIKDNPSKTPEDSRFSGLYKSGHNDVIKELPEILKRVCYHLDYFSQCVDIIWEIGRGDSRKTNPYPEHGVRILQGLAQYDIYELTGKGVEVNKLMLEAVKRWLTDPNLTDYQYSPFDILDELLDKESVTDIYEKGKITFHSFGVSFERTKFLRDEAMKLVVQFAKSDNLSIALRAIKSFGHALREPQALYGRKIDEKESDMWKPFQLSIIDELEKISVNSHPIVLSKIREIIIWHARYSPSEDIKRHTKSLFIKLFEPFEVKLVQALDQNHDREWLINDDKYDYKKMSEISLSFRKEVSSEFVGKYPDPKKGFLILQNMLNELEGCQENMPFPIMFFSEMAKGFPDYITSLCNLIIEQPKLSMSNYFGYFVFGLIEVNKKVTSVLLSKALKTKEEKLCYTVADYYWRGKWVNYFEEKSDLSNIKKLLENESMYIRRTALGSLGSLGKIRPDITKEILLSINIGTNKQMAENYFLQIDKEHGFNPDFFSENELDIVLSKLEDVEDIDDFQIEEFLNYTGVRSPLSVVKLLLKRVENSHANKGDREYKPLSYSSQCFLTGFSNTPKYIEVLREVRNKIVGKDWHIKFWIPKLFKSLSNNFDDTGIEVLQEWINSGKKEKIEGICNIIEAAPENFIFQHPEFVSKMFLAAKPFGQEMIKTTRSALAHSAIFRSKHGTIGQPSPEDIELKENSEKMITNYPVDSLEHELFESLIKYANSEIKRRLKDDEEFIV